MPQACYLLGTAGAIVPIRTITLVISDIVEYPITESSAVISWTTDLPATSRIQYGLTSSYGSQTTLDSNLVTGHSQLIGSLTDDTLYHYRVVSTIGGKTYYSDDGTFTTLAAGGAEPVITYGFEDGTNPDTAANYIFSTSASSYWDIHKNCTEVINNPASAHSGNNYLHRQFNTSLEDPLLGPAVSASVNDHNNIGLGAAYPSGSGNKTQLETAIVSNTLVCRFYFRCTNTWKTQTKTTGGAMGLLKFFRGQGNGGGTHDTAFVHLGAGNNTNTEFALYDSALADYDYYYAGVDLQDGNWHCAGIKVVRNNDTNETGNVTVSVWWDNWDMTGDPVASRTSTCSTFGDAFSYINLTQNWSATYPSTLMGIDLDDIEVWDGMPA